MDTVKSFERGGPILWFVNFSHVRGDIISLIGLLGWGGGGAKLISYSTSYLYFIRLLKSLLNDDSTGIATQVDLKTSTLEPLDVY